MPPPSRNDTLAEARRSRRLPLRVAGALGLVALAIHLAHGQLGLGDPALRSVVCDWLYDGALVGSAIACLARAWIVRESRTSWLLVGAGLGSFAIGEVYYSLAFGDSGQAPIPSIADFFYLLYYPFVYAGLILLARARIGRLSASTWLDGTIAATTAASVVAAVAFEPIVSSAVHGSAAAVATNLAYPIGDLILLGIIVAVAALSGWRPGRAWLLLGIAMGSMAIADVGYLYQTANNTYTVGGAFDSFWLAAALLAGCSAWQSDARARVERLEGRRVLVVPAVFALAALSVLVYGTIEHVNAVGLCLAALAVILIFVRGAWTLQENIKLLEASRTEALTDALTGLGNRRAMSAAIGECLQTAQQARLVMFDLDGFKAYNDRFGHVAGDTLLAHLGYQLREAVGPAGTAYRLGGDEFCVLLANGGKQADAYTAAAVAALSATGDGFSVSTSFGAVSLPDEASSTTVALRIADDRMYAQKNGRRSSARQQTHNVLLEVIHERQPEVHHHLREVGRLAVVVGRQLGMAEEQLDELHRAAELHDIGKAAIPDAILNKLGPLDEHEWAFMRRHTLVGERILAAAPALVPVAMIVRSSHERWDGTGYPDGLAGEAIPQGSRIVAVCDAFDAMTSDRPYAPAKPFAEALDELRASSRKAVRSCRGARIRGGVGSQLTGVRKPPSRRRPAVGTGANLEWRSFPPAPLNWLRTGSSSVP